MGNLFTEPEAYEALASQLRARATLLKPEPGLRAWVVGCGAGEDAYAVALLLGDVAAHTAPSAPVTVFATEHDPERLAVARVGLFPEALLTGLPPATREAAFFTMDGHAHVKAALRDRLVFGDHSLFDDPPFAQLDLLVCRELFATLAGPQQALAMERFAFALRPGGLLLLGAAPLDGAADPRFRDADLAHHLFIRTTFSAQLPAAPSPAPSHSRAPLSPHWEPAEALLTARQPALIVDRQLRIVQIGVGAERFLRLVPGVPAYDLLRVIVPGLRVALHTTISRARSHGRPAESAPILLEGSGPGQLVTIVAQPFAGGGASAGELLIFFDSAAAEEASPPALPSPEARPDSAALVELQAHHDVIYEELRVANEELQVSNEELLASTEELVARREELQSLNEQLQLVNTEQQHTLAALARTNADLQNLIASAEIGTLFLDRELRLQRYTGPVQSVFNLISADLGRPLAHLTHRLAYAGLAADAARVLVDLAPIEREAQHDDGRWFLVRLRSYRTIEQQVNGVVVTLLDISERRRAEEALRQSHEELELRVKERTAELERANAARQALLRELVQAQEAERLRIARELHDTLGQQITAVLLGLQTVKGLSHGRVGTLEQIDQIVEIVQAMGREMHEIAINLRPTALDDVGLAGALRALVEGWSRRTGVATELFVAGVEEHSLSPEVEMTLYRVAQEALTNVARHAEATRVSVILESDGSRVVAVVEDNGRGFDVEGALQTTQQHGHLGLLGMQERAALVGGTLTIESEVGAGTTLIARIPIILDEDSRNGHHQDPARRRP